MDTNARALSTLSRDAVMASIAHRIRRYTHPSETLAPWAAQMPDRLSRSRAWIALTAPATVFCAWLSYETETSWMQAIAWLFFAATMILVVTDMIDGPWARCIAGPTKAGEQLDNDYDDRARDALVASLLVAAVIGAHWLLLGAVLLRVVLEIVHTKVAFSIFLLIERPVFLRVPFDDDKVLFFMDMFVALQVLAACVSREPLWLAIALVCLGVKCIQSTWLVLACLVYRRRLHRHHPLGRHVHHRSAHLSR